MKKHFLILSVVAGFVACSGDGLRENAVQESKSLAEQYDPNRRSFAEAVEIARNSINMLEEDKAATRSVTPARKLNLKDGVKAFRKAGTRSGEAGSDNDTLLYVFNFEDNQGFSVVSASRFTDELIAVTELGNYDPAVPTGNPGFDTYMNMAKAYVAYKDKEGTEKEAAKTRGTTIQYPIFKPVYDTIYYQKILPRLTVKWGQQGMIGYFCPYGITGCSNTAAAQIMSYYKFPAGLYLTFEERDQDYTPLNWTAMCERVFTNFDPMDERDKQIGRLARQLGKLADSDYQSNYTETAINDIRYALQYVGYNVSTVTDYIYMINNNVVNSDAGYPLANLLAAGKLIFMGGENSSGIGHSWVIDGCKYVKALHRMMISYDGINWSVYQELGTYRTCHNHINWGFDGVNNGYFNHYVFDMNNAVSCDGYPYSVNSSHNYYDDVQYFAVWH